MATTKKGAAKRRAQTPKANRAKKATVKKPAATPREGALKPGATIEKTYKGEKHTVQATAQGYLHRGKTYASLTALAKAVTGYAAISGPAFFGLWQAKGGQK